MEKPGNKKKRRRPKAKNVPEPQSSRRKSKSGNRPRAPRNKPVICKLSIRGKKIFPLPSCTPGPCNRDVNDMYERRTLDVHIDQPLSTYAWDYEDFLSDSTSKISPLMKKKRRMKKNGRMNDEYFKVPIKINLPINKKQKYNLGNSSTWKVDKESQSLRELSTEFTESVWQCVDTTKDVDRLLQFEYEKSKIQNNIPNTRFGLPSMDGVLLTNNTTSKVDKHFHNQEKDSVLSPNMYGINLPLKCKQEFCNSATDIHISDIPRIKLVATRSTEVKTFKENIICLEYDVFDCKSNLKPNETIKAYFSVKSPRDECKDNPVTSMSKNIEYNITKNDSSLNVIDLEAINNFIKENSSYIEELKRTIIQRRERRNKMNNTKLDLISMYEKAIQKTISMKNDKMLSVAELNEILDSIMNECVSSTCGLGQRIMKPPLSSKYTNSIPYLIT